MKHLIGILILLFSFDGITQTENDPAIPLVKGEPFNTTRKENFNGFIGTSTTTLFTVDYLQINRKKQELNLRRFDKTTLKLTETKNLFSLIDDRFYNEPTEVFYQDDTIYLFSTMNGLKDRFNMIYLELFDEYGERIMNRIVDTLDLDDLFYITESDEKEGFLVATHNKYDNVFEQKIKLEAIGTDGKTDWENELHSPSSLQSLEIKEISYAINQPIYILCDYGFEVTVGNRSEGDLVNNNYAIWGYDQDLKFLKEFDLRLKNKWINGIKMAFDAKGDLMVGGFINESRNYSVNGVFSMQISPDLTVLRTNYYKYKRSFYEKFIEQKKLDKVKELDDIVIRDLIVMNDDSYFITAEHFYKYTERNYDPRTNITTTTDNYNYNSIVVAYFDKKGNHLWSERIPKFQHSVNDGGYFSSFSTMKVADELFLFFNDSDKNNDLKPTDYFAYKGLYNNRKFQITYVNVTPDGIARRGQLIDNKNDYMLRAKQSYQVEPWDHVFIWRSG